jgi:hypothetical protein
LDIETVAVDGKSVLVDRGTDRPPPPFSQVRAKLSGSPLTPVLNPSIEIPSDLCALFTYSESPSMKEGSNEDRSKSQV